MRGATSIIRSIHSTNLLLAQDGFTGRNVSGSWGVADVTGGAWNIPIGSPGAFSIASGVGNVVLPTTGAVQGADLLAATGTTVDVRFDVSFSKLPTAGNFVFATTWTRVSSDSVSSFYRIGIFVDSQGVVCLRGEAVPLVTLWADATPLGTPVLPAFPFSAGVWLTVAAQLTTNFPTTAQAKVWQVGTSEPLGWGVAGVDLNNTGPQTSGPVGIRTFSTLDAITVSFMNFRAVRI